MASAHRALAALLLKFFHFLNIVLATEINKQLSAKRADNELVYFDGAANFDFLLHPLLLIFLLQTSAIDAVLKKSCFDGAYLVKLKQRGFFHFSNNPMTKTSWS